MIVEEKKASFFAPRLSDELFGRFWRVLNPGTYTLRIRKKGYEEQILNNVTVNSSAWTNLNIQLNPLPEINVTGNITSDGEPVPAEVVIFDLENDSIFAADGSFDFQGFAGDFDMLVTADGFVPNYYHDNLAAGNHEINIELQPAVEIFSEDWSIGFSNWEVNGSWGILSETSSGENYVTDSPTGFYEDNSISVLTLNHFVNLMGVDDDVVLSFRQRYHTEHDVDLCKVEISANGDDWQQLAVYSGVNDYWQRAVLPLSDYMDHYLFLRFVLSTDATCNDPGWDIRDLKIVSSVGSAADEEEMIPIQNKLYANYPNPFRSATKIYFSISRKGAKNAKINIYNVKGQKIKQLTIKNYELGINKIIWNGKDEFGKSVDSGIYFYKLDTDNFSRTKKMIMIR